VVNEDDPYYEAVMAVARKDPAISITVTGIEECPECGEKFVGKMAKAQVARHRNQTHPGSKADSISRTETTKTVAQFACQIDGKEFKSEAALIEHTAEVHAPKPDENDDEGGAGGGAFSVEIPPAQPKG
jgi:hypothetical protein